ncbi:MAG TPA: methylated-DNA--[protein]-cysteine S-methyltransferase [Xanthomonadaceae bacterium]|nr:methylated-DNA--[protein]-cysteine S-methyltransferase [Xanthomonadaceae bacterium]
MDLPLDPDALYAALLRRDPAYEGFAYVGVRTTGVFCRLSCAARKPRRDNVEFFDSCAAAQAAGFRACLRCRPLERGRSDPLVHRVLRRVDAEPARRWTGAELHAAGFDPGSVRRAFLREYGTTFAQAMRARRLGQGMLRLQRGTPVVDAQLEAGYGSASGFREAVARLLGTAPAQARTRALLAARWLETPIGPMLAIAGAQGVHLLEFSDRTALPGELARLQRRLGPVCFGDNAMLDALAVQLTAYFDGSATGFDVPLAQHGSTFERTVWTALQAIPAGCTRSYGALAARLGRPGAARAVARANGANPLAILVPCHRVIGADGALTGYGGKLWRKRWLLEHERRMARRAHTNGSDASTATA